MTINSNSIYELATGRHLDADGLYLNVGASGRRSWQLRVKVNGKATMVSIGNLPQMGLSAARQRAKQIQAQAMVGIAPKPTKSSPVPSKTSVEPRNAGITVEAAWARYADSMVDSGGWTDEHHRRTNLQVNKHLGNSTVWKTPASALTRLVVVQTCESIKSREMRQRVFRWWRASHEEALNSGSVENNVFPITLPKSLARPASDKGTLAGDITSIEDLRALLTASWCCDAALSIRAAHRVVALSGHRIGAVLLSQVDAYDPQADTFTVPRENMKVRDTKHGGDVVIGPLSSQLRETLRQAQERATGIKSQWLFSNLSGAQPVLNESIIKHLNRIRPKGTKFTPHSWRSALMTWGLDNGYPREVMQAALDHARGTESDRAYDRSTLQDKVSEMLAHWGMVLCD